VTWVKFGRQEQFRDSLGMVLNCKSAVFDAKCQNDF
jgi:hypothetical protein